MISRLPGKGIKNWVLILLLAIFVFVSYSSSLPNGFVWDDEFTVVNNAYIRSFSYTPNIFRSYLASSSGNINNFYRPLQELSYILDYRLWKYNPFGFHLTNTILHALCAIALYFLASRILGGRVPAFITAALFAVHPVNTEAVTYISGRADSLFLLFFLLSFLSFIKATESRARGGLWKTAFFSISLFSFILSMLSKEIGIILPVFIILYLLVLRRNPAAKFKAYLASLPFLAIACLYGIARKTVLDFSALSPSFMMEKFNIVARLLTASKVLCVYLYLLVAPFGLHMERQIGIGNLSDPLTFGALLAVALFGFVLWRTYFKSKRLFFAGAWFILGLLPVSNIVPINSFLAEHWLYLPAIGMFMMAGIGCDNIFRMISSGRITGIGKYFIISGIASVLIFFGLLTFMRNKVWQDKVTFFKDTLRYSPNNARVHLMLGNVYDDTGRPLEALEEYKKALALSPDYVAVYNNIGSIYISSGKHKEARPYLEKALSLDPNIPQTIFMLGEIEATEGNFDQAEKLYLSALSLMPIFESCRMQLAQLYLYRGQIEQGIIQLVEVLRLNPANEEARQLKMASENKLRIE